MEKNYIVKVSPDLKHLVPRFMENRWKDLHFIRAAIAEKDLPSIKFVGHRMKGVCGGYGFHELGSLGTSIEAKAASGQVSDETFSSLESYCSEMEQFMKNVELIYE